MHMVSNNTSLFKVRLQGECAEKLHCSLEQKSFQPVSGIYMSKTNGEFGNRVTCVAAKLVLPDVNFATSSAVVQSCLRIYPSYITMVYHENMV